MIIYGIDPGIVNIGYAVVDADIKHHNLTILSKGHLKNEQGSLEFKLAKTYDFFDTRLSYSPDATVYEEPAFIKGENGVNILQALGVMKSALFIKNPKQGFFKCAPTELKKVVTSKGTASKTEVKDGIKDFFNIKVFNEADHVSDALATIMWYLIKKEDYLT